MEEKPNPINTILYDVVGIYNNNNSKVINLIINNKKFKQMKERIFNMIKFLLVLSAMITSIGVGIYALIYSIIHAWMYVLIFIMGVGLLALGIFTLNVVSEKLK